MIRSCKAPFRARWEWAAGLLPVMIKARILYARTTAQITSKCSRLAVRDPDLGIFPADLFTIPADVVTWPVFSTRSRSTVRRPTCEQMLICFTYEQSAENTGRVAMVPGRGPTAPPVLTD